MELIVVFVLVVAVALGLVATYRDIDPKRPSRGR
jgi:hypothetical protein